jgi:hypothetical protein
VLNRLLVKCGARATVFVNEDDKRVYALICIHHILIDGLSVITLMGDLMSALKKQTLPPLKLQYIDYAAAERAYLTDAVVESMLERCGSSLRNAPRFSAITSPSEQGPRRGRLCEEVSGGGRNRRRVSWKSSAAVGVRPRKQHAVDVERCVPRSLCSFARGKVRCRLFLVSSPELVKTRLSDVPDVLIGTVSQNRQLFADTETMMGYFVVSQMFGKQPRLSFAQRDQGHGANTCGVRGLHVCRFV